MTSTIYVKLEMPPDLQIGERGELLYMRENRIGALEPIPFAQLSMRAQNRSMLAWIDALVNGEGLRHNADGTWEHIPDKHGRKIAA